MKNVFLQIVGIYLLSHLIACGGGGGDSGTPPPKHSISSFVNALKTGTSRRLRNTFPDQIKTHYWKGVLWSRSFFIATCGGAPLGVIKEYINSQARPD